MSQRAQRKKAVLKGKAKGAEDDDGVDAPGGPADDEFDTTATAVSSTHNAGGSAGSQRSESKRPSRAGARRWAFDEGTSTGHATTLRAALNRTRDAGGVVITHHDVKSPPGFIAGTFDNRPEHKRTEDRAQDDLVYKSAMAIASAPGKQLLMTAFMLYMSGNTLQIFSIMMLGMALWQPVQKLMTVSAAFAKYSESHVDLTIPKLIYIICNLAAVALALYKVNSMGLLPTSAIDWLPTPVVQRPLEFSGGGVLSAF